MADVSFDTSPWGGGYGLAAPEDLAPGYEDFAGKFYIPAASPVGAPSVDPWVHAGAANFGGGLPAYGALSGAPASFPAYAPQAPINLEPVTNPDVLGRFYASQAPVPLSWSVADLLSPPKFGDAPTFGSSSNPIAPHPDAPSSFNGGLPPCGSLAAVPTSFDQLAAQPQMNFGAPSVAPAYANAADPQALLPNAPSSFSGALPPYGAFANAPKSFGEFAPLPANAEPVTDPDVLSRFYASQGFGAEASAPEPAIDPGSIAPQPVTDAGVLARFYASQALNTPNWSATDLPPTGALADAPTKFGDFVPPRSVADKLFGLSGERYQLWPERYVRGLAENALGIPQRLNDAMNSAPAGSREQIENMIGPVTDLSLLLGLRKSPAFGRGVPSPEIPSPTEQSVWSRGWSARGYAIEKQLGGDLPGGFRVIDKFNDGVATSIKSIDLYAPRYQNAEALSRTLNNYVDSLAIWEGQTKAYGGITIRPDEITERTLQVAIPAEAMNIMQRRAFEAAAARAKSFGVNLIVTPII